MRVEFWRRLRAYADQKIQRAQAGMQCAHCQRRTHEMQTFSITDADDDDRVRLWCGDCGNNSRFLDAGIIMIGDEPNRAVERGAPARSYIADERRKITLWDVFFPQFNKGAA